MKRIFCIISLFVLCLTFNQAHAQRMFARHERITGYGRYGGRCSLEQTKRFRLLLRGALSTYTKNGNRWVIGGEYLEKHYPYKELKIPVNQFTGEGGYYLNFLSDRKKTFFLSLGLSALAGYETSNWGDKLLPDGSTLTDKDGFVYGGALTLELESYITDRVVFLINARESACSGLPLASSIHSSVSG